MKVKKILYFLRQTGSIPNIKPANYEISKTCKYRNDIEKIENMEYDAESKSKTGYVSEKRFTNARTAADVRIKGSNWKTPLEERTKTLQVAKAYLKYR